MTLVSVYFAPKQPLTVSKSMSLRSPKGFGNPFSRRPKDAIVQRAISSINRNPAVERCGRGKKCLQSLLCTPIMGARILPQEQGEGRPEEAVFSGRAGRAGTPEKDFGRLNPQQHPRKWPPLHLRRNFKIRFVNVYMIGLMANAMLRIAGDELRPERKARGNTLGVPRPVFGLVSQ